MKGKEEKKFGPKLDATTSTLPGPLSRGPPRPGPGYNVPPEPPLVGSGSLHHQTQPTIPDSRRVNNPPSAVI